MGKMKFTGIKREEFKNPSPPEDTALKVALETRKFEIDLYWKRATYYWAFNAAIFVAFFAVMSEKFTAQQSQKEYLVIIAGLGLLFGLGWYLANRGSKYWQDNWESITAFLEDETIGPLFKTTLKISTSMLDDPLGAHPYSVTRINVLLSIFMLFVWCILLIINVLPLSCKLAPDWLIIIYLLFVLIFICFLLTKTKSTAQSMTIAKEFNPGSKEN